MDRILLWYKSSTVRYWQFTYTYLPFFMKIAWKLTEKFEWKNVPKEKFSLKVQKLVENSRKTSKISETSQKFQKHSNVSGSFCWIPIVSIEKMYLQRWWPSQGHEPCFIHHSWPSVRRSSVRETLVTADCIRRHHPRIWWDAQYDFKPQRNQ